MKRVLCVLVSVLLLGVGSHPVSAAQIRPTDSFTHQNTGSGQETVAMPDVFAVSRVVSARSLGFEESLSGISDMTCDEKGHVYVLTEEGLIVEFDKDGSLIGQHILKTAAGEEITFSGAQGILAADGMLYVADTQNNRVLCSTDDVVKQEITVPESALIPSDFVFSPTKIAKDGKDYLYVISKGSYYGAVMYDPAGTFVGFYGANTVQSSVLSTLAYFWDTLTQNDIKRGKKVKTLPYQFVDICVDADDFVYTCTGLTSGGTGTGQVRMLSPGGTNILYRMQKDGTRVGSASFNFGETDYARRLKQRVNQNFESVAVDADGYIYALDIVYGLVYVYDTDCHLITAFGGGEGMAAQDGQFIQSVALAVSEDRVYVADAQNGSVTVFEKTAFGQTLMAAQKLTLDSRYTESEALWDKVLQQDAGNQLALCAKGKIAYLNGDYSAAMAYAQEGLDYVVYGQALKQLQTAFISRNFGWLFGGALLLIAGLTAAAVWLRRRKKAVIRHPKLRIFFRAFLHPFESFNAVRYKDGGSLALAVFLTVLYFVSGVLAVLESNFRFTSFDEKTFNSLFEILRTVGLVLLFSLANWGISVLLQGIGKLRHVFIVTAYSTFPLIVYNFVSILLSWTITSPTSTLLHGLMLTAMIWTGVVLSVGLMVVHDFSFFRYLVSVAVGLFFMFLIVFILFVFGILVSQLWSFASTVFLEYSYR